MISKNAFQLLKDKYGSLASWAIWNTDYSDKEPKKNTSDLTVFDNPDLLSVINTGYVFVGLNASSTHGDTTQGRDAWYNFHSNYSRQNDYKLRYALQGTKYWGSYITDVIKWYAEVDSNKVLKYLKVHPEVAKANIDEFREEMILLGEKPVLIAMGGLTYNILQEHLQGEYEIKQIMHYSYTIGKEDYRKAVLRALVENLTDYSKEGDRHENNSFKKRI